MASSISFVFPRLSAGAALNVLWEARECLSVLNEGGFCVLFRPEGEVQFLAPDPGQTDGENRRPLDEALTTFEKAFASSGRRFSRSEGRRSMQIDNLPGIGLALFWLILETTRDTPAKDTDDRLAHPIDGEALAVLEEVDTDGFAEQIATVVTLASGSRIGVSEDQTRHVVLHVRNDAERGALIAGLEASGACPDLIFLRGYATVIGPIFLPKEIEPYERCLQQVADILRMNPNLLELASEAFEQTVGYAIKPSAKDDWNEASVFCFELPTRDGEQITEPAAEGLQFRLHLLKDSEKAALRLREDIARGQPASGYRLSLHRLPEGQIGTSDVEQLQERIVELQERIELIIGLQAPQFRLLRFDTKMLPALADGLRRFPVSAIDNGEIQYGFQANTKAALGNHYLLFEPHTTVMRHPFPEWHWRSAGNDNPITFWIDPYWAQYYQAYTPKSLVFVPLHHVLLPTLHSFTEGDMDAYLREIMSRWFPEEEEARRIPEYPIYLFKPSEEPGFDITVEVIDRTSFQPLRERLGWINENLELVDAIDTHAFVEEGAYQDYRHRVAQDLRGRADETERVLFSGADALEGEFFETLDRILGRLADEIETTAERAKNAAAFVDELTDRTVALERVLASTFGEAKGAEAAADKILEVFPEFERFREDFDERLLRSFEQVDELINATQPRINGAIARLQRLHEQLDRLRHE